MLRIKLIREGRGLRQFEFAAWLGYNPQLWHQVENGQRTPPKVVVERASLLLGMPVEVLFQPITVTSDSDTGEDDTLPEGAIDGSGD